MMTLQEIWRLISGGARHEAERANEKAYRNLDRRMCERGIDGLSDIDRLMRGGQRANGRDHPVS